MYNNNQPLVSICCITYNHKNYIRDAIKGFLMQKATFPIEIIIHDDASTDGTADIIKEFVDKHPNLIIPIFQTENQYSKGVRNITAKFTFPIAHGKYIALCEGDDYWTDPLKLQKQVEFLEENENCVLCFHDAKTIDEKNQVISETYPNKPFNINTSFYTIEDFIVNPSNFIPTASIVFKKSAIEKNITLINKSKLGDIFLIVSICAEPGDKKLLYINEVMSVYRIHRNGVYMGMSELDKRITSISARIKTSRYFLDYHDSFDIWLDRTIRELIESNQYLNNKNQELIHEINILKQGDIKVAIKNKIFKLIKNIGLYLRFQNFKLFLEKKIDLLQESNKKNPLNYKSYQDLSLTINKNLHKIPRDIDLVVGIPRSGLLPATMISQILNKPVVALDSFLEGKIYEIGLYRRPNSLIQDFSEIKRVLVIDDSINSGNSLQKVREKIEKSERRNIDTIYSAVYYVPESLNKIDIGLEECLWPRIFQWNILNSWVLANACIDIDGVVCVDPSETENDDGSNYKYFILNAKPLFLTEQPISCFITSRLEKYRELTSEWLKNNNLKYNELIMLDLPSKEERIKQNIHAVFKANVYKNRKEELFIESNLSQAIEIAKLTGKLVFCTENMEMIMFDTNKSDLESN